MRQTSRPDNTGSLGNGDLQMTYVDFLVLAFSDFFRRGGFKKKFESFFEIGAGFFNRIALTHYIHFRAKRNISVAFPLNQHGQSFGHNGSPPENNRIRPNAFDVVIF